MNMRNIFKFSLSMLLSCSLVSARAQQDSTKLYQKAEQLFIVMNMPDVYATAIKESVEQQIAASPALAKFKDDVTSFFDTYISWHVIHTEVARLYLKYYTAEDMDVLIKFYQTPAGKKVAVKSTILMKEIQQMQQSRLQAHIGELNQLIENKAKS